MSAVHKSIVRRVFKSFNAASCPALFCLSPRLSSRQWQKVSCLKISGKKLITAIEIRRVRVGNKENGSWVISKPLRPRFRLFCPCASSAEPLPHQGLSDMGVEA
jgi:hypothetical protein